MNSFKIKSSAHSRNGVAKILESPSAFNFWQKVTGAEKWKSRLIREYIKPYHGARILDVGCGTGSVLNYITKNIHVDYVGCDINPDYIARAMKKFGNRGAFYCCDINALPEKESGFDFALAIGIFHHLDDNSAMALVASVKKKLTPEGKFFIAEPVWTEKQSRVEKHLMKNDRGKNIKTEKEYLSLVKRYFLSPESTIIRDSHIIPWTATLIICKNSL